MNSHYLKILGLHILLGVIIYFSKALGDVYFYGVVGYFIYRIIAVHHDDKPFEVIKACVYILSAEVLFRMTNSGLFYESSKYLVILFSVLGLFYKGFSYKATPYVLYILLLIPGIYVSLYALDVSPDIRKAIAFNLSGPVCIGIAALFCMRVIVTNKQLEQILNFAVYPLVSTVVYIIVFNPDVSGAIRGTGSNFVTSGGFGPNQVSTVLGLGAFFMAVKYFKYSKTPVLRYIDLAFIMLFSFRAVVTFSRGGVLTAIIMIVCFLFFQYRFMDKQKRSQMFLSGFLFLGVIAVAWVYSSIQTRGLIDKRYANENARGVQKVDITTGRVYLLKKELNEFIENPFLGVGVGRIKDIRFQETGIRAASHNEVSRIISEHGLLGVLAFSILLLVPLVFRITDRSNVLFYSFYIFWFLTINHSAMRIAAPAFIYALSLLHIKDEEPVIHRQ
ncbi:O-antigen ligase family protein [Aestuariibaculum sediminum]|uniref:O-antigen ligase family protein n=1 Tax=Aestuariibaculum sediminum TaxID=2770637 RepID=A0A8J6Q1M2_9FLAO|nr:O-antigen ligase family protein [Aestuariibaculum sediminum]MBD0833107.1 O-antigen ligase family protein [Aestuariibaculum sediminum]